MTDLQTELAKALGKVVMTLEEQHMFYKRTVQARQVSWEHWKRNYDANQPSLLDLIREGEGRLTNAEQRFAYDIAIFPPRNCRNVDEELTARAAALKELLTK